MSEMVSRWEWQVTAKSSQGHDLEETEKQPYWMGRDGKTKPRGKPASSSMCVHTAWKKKRDKFTFRVVSCVPGAAPPPGTLLSPRSAPTGALSSHTQCTLPPPKHFSGLLTTLFPNLQFYLWNNAREAPRSIAWHMPPPPQSHLGELPLSLTADGPQPSLRTRIKDASDEGMWRQSLFLFSRAPCRGKVSNRNIFLQGKECELRVQGAAKESTPGGRRASADAPSLHLMWTEASRTPLREAGNRDARTDQSFRWEAYKWHQGQLRAVHTLPLWAPWLPTLTPVS